MMRLTWLTVKLAFLGYVGLYLLWGLVTGEVFA